MSERKDSERTYEEGYRAGWMSVRDDNPAEPIRELKAVGVTRYKFGFEMGLDDARMLNARERT